METFKAEDKEAIKNIIAVYGGDGHTVYTAESLIQTGVRPELAKRFIETYESDFIATYESDRSSHDGQVVKKFQGVYGLTVLEAIADDLGLEYPLGGGRGFRAGHATSAIVNWLKTA